MRGSGRTLFVIYKSCWSEKCESNECQACTRAKYTHTHRRGTWNSVFFTNVWARSLSLFIQYFIEFLPCFCCCCCCSARLVLAGRCCSNACYPLITMCAHAHTALNCRIVERSLISATNKPCTVCMSNMRNARAPPIKIILSSPGWIKSLYTNLRHRHTHTHTHQHATIATTK